MAVVVGVGNYKNLPRESRLQGPANDAAQMVLLLKKQGFTISELLVDGAATKEAIMAALTRICVRMRGMPPTERFVFYFAGHGTDKPPAILPADARASGDPARNISVITKSELKVAVSSINAASRTVILDSCFSGGMKSGSLRRKLIPRYFSLEPTGSRGGAPSVGADVFKEDGGAAGPPVVTPTVVTPAAPICYLAAAMESQKAYEDEFEKGQHYGLFTHHLVKKAGADGASSATLGQVIKKVTADVVEYSDELQRPTVTPGLEAIPLFGKRPGIGSKPPPPAPDSSVWDVYTTDRPNPAAMRLLASPDKTNFSVGEMITLAPEVKQEGYLVILNRDSSGRLYRLYPEGSNAEDGHYIPGDNVAPFEIKLPDPGVESFRLLFFRKKEEAEDLMRAVPGSDAPAGLDVQGSKRAVLRSGGSVVLFSSHIVIQVSKREPASPGAQSGP